MTITTILFDLDGTLYPIASSLTDSFDTRITDYVARLLDLNREQAFKVRQTYFTTYGTTLRGLQNHHNVDIEDYLAYTHDPSIYDDLALDQALDALLSDLPARLIVFTNSPVEHAQSVLRALGIERHFERIFDIRFLEFLPKPAEQAYRRVLAELGVAGNETVLIEDTLRNIAPAQALGITTILIAPDGASDSAADIIVPDVATAVRAARALLADRHP